MVTEGAGASRSTIAQEDRIMHPSSLLYLLIPVIAFIAALAYGGRLYLDYVHVLIGGLWTGIDLFMGLVVGRILGKLSIGSRVEFIKRLIPIMLFLMPSLASVAVTSGVYLAMAEGIFSLHYYTMITAGIIVAILLIQGLGIFLPNEVRIFLEIRKDEPDGAKISRLGMINFRLSTSQAFFQVALIFVMASITMMHLNF